LSEYNIAYIHLLFSSLHLDLASDPSFYAFRPIYMCWLLVVLTHTTDPVSLHEMIVRTERLCTTLARESSAS